MSGSVGDNPYRASGVIASAAGGGAITWCSTVKTAGLTAVSGEGYFMNTTSTGLTVTLPTSPTVGDTVAIKDYAGTFATNNLTIGRAGENIDGGSDDATLATNNNSQTFVYVDATKGWQVVNDSTVNIKGVSFTSATGGTESNIGDYTYHVFTATGCFTVSSVGTSCCSGAEALVVAGGGGSGTNGAGGSGAGGLRNIAGACIPISASPGTYAITVGGGGSGQPNSTETCSGTNSVFSTITSAGGGGGGQAGCSPPTAMNGKAGGSGGGGGGNGRSGTAGSGNSPPTPVAQGNDGGASVPGPCGNAAGGGGGGATAAGANAEHPAARTGGAGGAGLDASPDYPAPLGGSPAGFYGGGGGGAANDDAGTGVAGAPGPGGGGIGGQGTGATPGATGVVNTGGGAGGGPTTAGMPCGANGGSGVVIIRYKYQ